MSTTNEKYSPLFTPWKIRNVEIKNRIVMCPMGGTSLFGWFELTGCNPEGRAEALTITPLAGGVRAVSAHLVIVQIQ